MFRKRIGEIAAFRPFVIFVAGLVIIGSLLTGLDKIAGHTLKGLYNMAMLVERFVDMPKQILGYGSRKFSGEIVFQNMPGSDSGYNIDSRLTTTAAVPDNGYIAMLQDGGWPSLVAWVILWLLLVGIGVQALRKAPGIRSAYSLSVVIGCALSGMFVRAFQVFPFWVMISLSLSLCLTWYSIVFGKKETVAN